MPLLSQNSLCHCGNPLAFTDCCQPLITGLSIANDAEQLMRSRFTAFKLRQHQYILDTQKLVDKPPMNSKDFDSNIHWVGLLVLESGQSEPNSEKHQAVEFVAFFHTAQSNLIQQLHEKSSFIKQGKQWFYTEGRQLNDIKIPRNSRCFCNSGKKYKQCHALTEV
jgi:SEC-C motif domain protein